MWLECLSEQVYSAREDIAADLVHILREELADLLDGGAALVQFDEPVLSEIVFSGAKSKRNSCAAHCRNRSDPRMNSASPRT